MKDLPYAHEFITSLNKFLFLFYMGPKICIEITELHIESIIDLLLTFLNVILTFSSVGNVTE